MWNCLRSNADLELEKIEARCGVQQFKGVDTDGHTPVYSGRCVQSKRPGTGIGQRAHKGQHRDASGYMWLPNHEWDFWFDYTSDDFLVRQNKERFAR